MDDIKQDRRIAKTKKALESALIDLMEKKSIEQITTTELCKEADINRNTFYMYYDNPTDLLMEIEDRLLDKIRNILASDSEKDMTRSIFRIFEQNSRVYRILFSNSHSRLADFTLALCKERNIYEWRKNNNKIQKKNEMFFQYASAGAGKLVMMWLENDCDMPAEELCDLIDQFSLFGLNALNHL